MNFNEALVKAVELAKGRIGVLQEDVYLVRDLLGRIRVLLKKKRGDHRKAEIESLAAELERALGVYTYSADDMVMYREELKNNIALPEEDSSSVLAKEAGFAVRLHDRLLLGTEWNTVPPEEARKPKRFTLFSMKGGVGRTTTTTILAWHLARKGKRVLVLDLDLESPGVGSTLLPGGNLPDLGIVDWFVEDVLGQGEQVFNRMVAESPLMDALPGRIAVAPTFGSQTGDYLTKLGRAYLERGPKGPEAWPQRLLRLVEALEAQETPDIVLLDSRTGLHDTSAALILAMGAQTLMFAADSRQTWTSYLFLFEHWKRHPHIRKFRDKLWVLGSMIPETDRPAYMKGLNENAWKLFLNLYDQAPATADPAAFTFGENDEDAPHTPRPIYWNRALQTFDPTSSLDVQIVEAAYGFFLKWFDDTLLVEPVPT